MRQLEHRARALGAHHFVLSHIPTPSSEFGGLDRNIPTFLARRQCEHRALVLVTSSLGEVACNQMRQAAGNGRAREATRRQNAERSGDRCIQGGAGHAEVYRPTVRRGERLVNRLHLKVLHLASAVEARGRGGDRPPQGVARRMAKITLATIAAGHDVAERVDDDTDPALGCACPPKDLLNGARRDADRQNKASPPTAYDRNGDRDETLAADGTEGADLANGRAFRPQRLLEAAAIVDRSERLANGMHGVEQLSARGIGKRNRLHERPTLEDSLRFRPEQLEIGLIERWQSRKRRRGLDSLAEF